MRCYYSEVDILYDRELNAALERAILFLIAALIVMYFYMGGRRIGRSKDIWALALAKIIAIVTVIAFIVTSFLYKDEWVTSLFLYPSIKTIFIFHAILFLTPALFGLWDGHTSKAKKNDNLK